MPTYRRTFDVFVDGEVYLNFETRENAKEWLKDARSQGRLAYAKIEIRQKRSVAYRIGDLWRADFDYDGMLKAGVGANVAWGASKLKKLFDSFESVNYHGPGSPLWSAVGHLERGEREKAHKALSVFRRVCEKMLATNYQWYPDLNMIEKEIGEY